MRGHAWSYRVLDHEGNILARRLHFHRGQNFALARECATTRERIMTDPLSAPFPPAKGPW